MQMNELIVNLLTAKTNRRKHLAALSFSEKIEIIEKLRDLALATKKNRKEYRSSVNCGTSLH